MIPVSLAQLERLEGKPRASGDDPAVHMAIESELW